MSREASRLLFAIASEQGGYFTAKQARDAGYDYPHLDYHLGAGNFARVGHGLYRLTHLPPSEHDDLIRRSLWSRNRADEISPRGTYLPAQKPVCSCPETRGFLPRSTYRRRIPAQRHVCGAVFFLVRGG